MREMKLVSYDATWLDVFEDIKKDIKSIFHDFKIEFFNIGSTSIEGMLSKPIVDVLVVFDSILDCDIHQVAMKLKGYILKGEHGIAGRRYFQKFSDDGINHSAHIHCFEKSHHAVMDHIIIFGLETTRLSVDSLKDILVFVL
ncbi:MAG: GrpB family protein [Acholeplasmataceae bacterium]|nr:GrpB family protein [Acholeplasmataceae bacterium]